jgi:acetylornithine deacetylase/succinyl-diaminopimelate desuccinylase-like protein
VNATIHQIDERVAIDDLKKLPNVFYAMMASILGVR